MPTPRLRGRRYIQLGPVSTCLVVSQFKVARASCPCNFMAKMAMPLQTETLLPVLQACKKRDEVSTMEQGCLTPCFGVTKESEESARQRPQTCRALSVWR